MSGFSSSFFRGDSRPIQSSCFYFCDSSLCSVSRKLVASPPLSLIDLGSPVCHHGCAQPKMQPHESRHSCQGCSRQSSVSWWPPGCFCGGYVTAGDRESSAFSEDCPLSCASCLPISVRDTVVSTRSGSTMWAVTGKANLITLAAHLLLLLQ